MTRHSSWGDRHRLSAPLLRDRFGAKAARQLAAPTPPTPRLAVVAVATMYGLCIGVVIAVAGALLGWW